MSTSGVQYDRWKQATSKELQAFLKTAWKEPTPEVRSRYFASKKKVVMQLLVFSLKPMTAEKKEQGLVGDKYLHHQRRRSPSQTVLAVQANPKHVLASFDVSNAFLNAELSEDVIILTQPAPELIQFGLVRPLPVHESMLWVERSTKVTGRSQKQDLGFFCLPDGPCGIQSATKYLPSQPMVCCS